nr:hypothetical protein [Tanacetum cinerariifolium]
INNKDALVDGKEHDDIKKSVSPDIHSSSCGDQTRKQEFEECINNGSNGVNAAGSSISATSLNFTNSTNDFSAAGPSNTTASPPVENSALQNVSTSSHDADMPNLEDYTHSDDADDVVHAGNAAGSVNPAAAIGTKWVYRNKKDERARIEANRLFLAYASFMGFLVYQMDVKSAFLYGTIEEEVYVCQPPGFEDPEYLDKVYKVVK